MRKEIFTVLGLTLLLICLLVPTGYGRHALDMNNPKDYNSGFGTAIPVYQAADHYVGKLQLTVTNIGTFCDGYMKVPSPFTGRVVKGCEYPKGSGIRYGFAGAFWIGAIVGRDTLVSTGADGWTPAARELNPDENGALIYRSQIDPTSPAFEGAISEEDIIAVYMDTLTAGVDNDGRDNRPHRPLKIRITENSYAWSYGYAEDFILFDYKITNTGFSALQEVFMGIYVDADVGFDATCDPKMCYTDDICGFVLSVPDTLTTRLGNDCIYEDTVNIAFIADDNGDPTNSGTFNEESCTSVTATRIIRTPSQELDVSFNWWISNGAALMDFGPREREFRGRWKEPFRNWGYLGTPSGDRNKYYVMRNMEFDYDQVYTSTIRPDDTLWLPPLASEAQNFSDGFDTRYLLSFGPFDIDPGETLPLSFAYVGGENFHVDPDNGDNLHLNYDPDLYYANLDFRDLTLNARWASWIYDNPGVDTDGDGDRGKYIVCIDSALSDTGWVFYADTNYVSGDGIPDFEGAKPPPAPDIRVLSETGKLIIRFNGVRSETTADEFLARSTHNQVRFDFEGYRVYLARDERSSSYSLVSSYDREDYNRYIFMIDEAHPEGFWNLLEIPYTADSLQVLYNDAVPEEVFDPMRYDRFNPLQFGDSLFYFSPQDFNAYRPGIDTDIRKRFPDQPVPSSLDVTQVDPSELTEDGYLKYYDYELIIDNLLSTVQYWVNITAFDFGSPQSGLTSLESSRTIGAIPIYPQPSPDYVAANHPKVYVYPNPYRMDGDYRKTGYEGRGLGERDDSDDRVRQIHFVNVPPQCTIRIYSLDGDLVRELDHNVDSSIPTATHATWSLITRNTQQAVSGVYYWTVEDGQTGEIQMGKLVLIM